MSHSGAHAFGWSRFHLWPKGDVSSFNEHKSKSKFAGVHEISNQPKIRVNHQMEDVILLDSVSQSTIFKQKDCVDNIFISKNDHCIHSSGKGNSYSHLR